VTTPDPAPDLGGDQPLTRLRGASVDVDVRRAGHVVLAVCLAAVLVTAVILLVAGIDKNDQITSLRQDGVPVAVRVTACTGLLGGSGSNAAGYACSGTYTVAGRHYEEPIPGRGLLATGSVVRGITVPADPNLLSTPTAVAGERTSWRVFIVPVILFGVVALVAVVLLVRRRRKPMASPPGH
jgi:hypothetical protein